jgi:acetylornithine/succinyldiaminopimelate/putrescine aminotransferase
MTEQENWIELEKQYFLPTSKRVPITLVRGEGTHVWDLDGRKYLDFVAGIAVVSLGHCHPEVVKAIERADAHLELLLHDPAGEAGEAPVRQLGAGQGVLLQ